LKLEKRIEEFEVLVEEGHVNVNAWEAKYKQFEAISNTMKKQLTAEVEELKGEVEELKGKLEESSSDLFSMQEKFDEDRKALEVDNNVLKQQYDGAEDAIKKLKIAMDEKMGVALQECADMTVQATQAEKRISEMYEDNANKTNMFNHLQKQHEQLLRDYEVSNSGSTSHIRQLEEARKMVTILTGKAQDSEETNLALKAQLDQASQENSALAARLERARAESAVKEVAKARGSVTQLSQDGPSSVVGSEVKSNLSETMENVALSSMAEEIEKVVERMEKRIAAEMSAKLENPTLFSPVLQKLDALMKISSPAPVVPPPVVNLDSVMSKLDDIAKLHSPVLTKLDDISRVQMTPTKLAHEFDSSLLDKEIGALKQQLETKVKEGVQTRADLQSVKQELQAKEQELAGLQSVKQELQELQAKEQELAGLQSMKQQLQAKEQELVGLNSMLAGMEEEMAEQSKNLKLKEEELLELREKSAGGAATSGASPSGTESGDVKLLKEELEREKADKKALKKAAKQLQLNVKHLQDELAGLKERWPEVAEAEASKDPCCNTCSPDLFLPTYAPQQEVVAAKQEAVAAKQEVVKENADNVVKAEFAPPAPEPVRVSTDERKDMARKKFEEERKAMMMKAKNAKLEKARKDREEELADEARARGEDAVEPEERKPAPAPAPAPAPEEEVEEEEEVERKPAAIAEHPAASMAAPPTPPTGSVGADRWKEETDDHPLPNYGLDSPVISHLLASWTTDVQKIQYLRLYLQCLTDYSKEVPTTFPKGLTLLGLNEEVKDGFLTLVMPMLQGRTDGITVKVYSRIGEATADAGSGGDGSRNGGDVIYDLRLKIFRPVAAAPQQPGIGGGSAKPAAGEAAGQKVEPDGGSAAAATTTTTTSAAGSGFVDSRRASGGDLKDRIAQRLNQQRDSGK
jgi:hypothetical protein